VAEKQLVLCEVMESKTHWADPNLVNPCTKCFVEWCIENFPAGRTLNGIGNTLEHFHGWVNEQTHPMVIPIALTAQMWELREKKKPRPIWSIDYYPV
jgi:hypothetical protein